MLEFEAMAKENLQVMSLSLVVERLKQVTAYISDEGDCPLCGAWVQCLDGAGNEIEADGSIAALREEHTATCPIGLIREQLKVVLQPVPVTRT